MKVPWIYLRHLIARQYHVQEPWTIEDWPSDEIDAAISIMFIEGIPRANPLT